MAVTHLTQGKLLSAEQSVRLALIDSVDRQKLIEAIVGHLRRAAASRRGLGDHSPRSWYATRLQR